MEKTFKEKATCLKLARDSCLKLHKLLMDRDRALYESEQGAVSAGKFLELLLSDGRFEWLRILSTLIVRIDESFDFDDGLSQDMLDGFQREILDIFDESSMEYEDFRLKFRETLPYVEDGAKIKDEIINLVKW